MLAINRMLTMFNHDRQGAFWEVALQSMLGFGGEQIPRTLITTSPVIGKPLMSSLLSLVSLNVFHLRRLHPQTAFFTSLKAMML